MLPNLAKVFRIQAPNKPNLGKMHHLHMPRGTVIQILDGRPLLRTQAEQIDSQLWLQARIRRGGKWCRGAQRHEFTAVHADQNGNKRPTGIASCVQCQNGTKNSWTNLSVGVRLLALVVLDRRYQGHETGCRLVPTSICLRGVRSTTICGSEADHNQNHTGSKAYEC